MKNLFLLFAIPFLLSCKKDDVKPTPYPHKSGEVRVEIFASDPNIIFQLNSTIQISGWSAISQPSNIAKSVSIINPISNISDTKTVSVHASVTNSAYCNIPITINIYFDGQQLSSKTYTTGCSETNNEVGGTTALPGYLKK